MDYLLNLFIAIFSNFLSLQVLHFPTKDDCFKNVTLNHINHYKI